MKVHVIGDALEIDGVVVLRLTDEAPHAVRDALRETLETVEFDRLLRRAIANGRANR